MPTKRVRVHYRRFHRGREPAIGDSLSSSMTEALNRSVGEEKIGDSFALRSYDDPDYGTIILNGLLPSGPDFFYGELVRCDPDTNIPLLVKNSQSKAELEVRELIKPENTEFLRGMSFFLLHENHVFVIEQSVSNIIMERYLRWLFCEQACNAIRSTRIPLIPKMFIGKKSENVPKVRRISLLPSLTRLDELFSRANPAKSMHSMDVDTSTNIIEILRAAHFDTAIIERIMRESGASLQLKLTMTLKEGRSAYRIAGEDAVTLLRNVPEDDLVVVGEGIRNNRGQLEQLSNQVDIERKGNILDRRDAWRTLRKAARSYREAGLLE